VVAIGAVTRKQQEMYRKKKKRGGGEGARELHVTNDPWIGGKMRFRKY